PATYTSDEVRPAGTRERDVDGMPLGGPARGQPRPTGGDQDQRVRLAPDEAQALRSADLAVPELEAAGLKAVERGEEVVGDEPHLRDAAELGRAEVARSGRILEPTVSDELDDVPGRIVHVARARSPEVEVERRLSGLRVCQQGGDG